MTAVLACLTDAQVGALGLSGVRPGGWWWTGATSGGALARPVAARVQRVIASARVVVTVDHDGGDGTTRRVGMHVADDQVLLDALSPRGHQMSLVDHAEVVSILAIGLDPHDVARVDTADHPGQHVLTRQQAAAAAAATAAEVVSSVRVARVALGPPPTETVVTVRGTRAGVEVWRALPDGRVVVAPVSRDDVVTVAAMLLRPAGPRPGHPERPERAVGA